MVTVVGATSSSDLQHGLPGSLLSVQGRGVLTNSQEAGLGGTLQPNWVIKDDLQATGQGQQRAVDWARFP